MATEEIDQQVQNLQGVALEVSNAVRSVTELMEKASGMCAVIAASVGQQANAVTDIARSITSISKNSEEISQGISLQGR